MSLFNGEYYGLTYREFLDMDDLSLTGHIINHLTQQLKASPQKMVVTDFGSWADKDEYIAVKAFTAVSQRNFQKKMLGI
jgi:hypothetical protein